MVSMLDAMVKRDGRPMGSRSLWGAKGSFAGLTANVPEAGQSAKRIKK